MVLKTAVNEDAHVIYEFAGRRLDPARRQLVHAGKPVAMFPRCFDALLLLVEQRGGNFFDKEFLLASLWPDVAVDENSLAKVISEVRRVLGEAPRDSGCIETVPRRGYRFTASVEVLAGPTPGRCWPPTRWFPEIRSLAVLPFGITNPRAGDDSLGARARCPDYPSGAAPAHPAVRPPQTRRVGRLRRLATFGLIGVGGLLLLAAAGLGESGGAAGFLVAALGAMVSGTGILVGARLVGKIHRSDPARRS